MELGKGETPQGDRTQTAIHGRGWHILVLFLGLLVAVTGACFVDLGDPYETADSYGGYDEEDDKANDEERGATDGHTTGKLDEGWKQQGGPEQEVEQRP